LSSFSKAKEYISSPSQEFIYELTGGEGLEQALEVAREVFVEEQGIPVQLVEEGKETATYLVVRTGQRAVGTARIRLLSPTLAKLERMAVLKSFRNQGIGKGIISFLARELKARGITKLRLNAQRQVVAFYRRCGFREVGQPFLEAGIEHLRMEKHL